MGVAKGSILESTSGEGILGFPDAPRPRPQPSLSCLWRVSSHTSKQDESRAVQDRGLGSILVQKSSP